MAKKYYGSHTWTEICAFWAMVISGFAYLFGGIVKIIIKFIRDLNGSNTANLLSTIYNILTFVGNIALIIAVAIPAWSYVRCRGKGWKAVYWIALIGFAFGSVLGMLSGFGIIAW